jgi:hypothetical protein
MRNLRKWRFPVLIGGGIVAAGTLFYLADAHVSSRATQGTIAHRDVYREGDVKPGDIGTPGAAPVAVKAVLESKDFQKLTKNRAFQGLMNSQSFQATTRNAAFWDLVRNSSFVELTQSSEFRHAMQNEAIASKLLANQAHGMTAGLRDQLVASHMDELSRSASFATLSANKSFNALLNQAAFNKLLASNEFKVMMGNASFLTLASSAQFENALLAGSAANLTAAMNSSLSSQLTLQ